MKQNLFPTSFSNEVLFKIIGKQGCYLDTLHFSSMLWKFKNLAFISFNRYFKAQHLRAWSRIYTMARAYTHKIPLSIKKNKFLIFPIVSVLALFKRVLTTEFVVGVLVNNLPWLTWGLRLPSLRRKAVLCTCKAPSWMLSCQTMSRSHV